MNIKMNDMGFLRNNSKIVIGESDKLLAEIVEKPLSIQTGVMW
jgi:hypothetical protein